MKVKCNKSEGLSDTLEVPQICRTGLVKCSKSEGGPSDLPHFTVYRQDDSGIKTLECVRTRFIVLLL